MTNRGLSNDKYGSPSPLGTLYIMDVCQSVYVWSIVHSLWTYSVLNERGRVRQSVTGCNRICLHNSQQKDSSRAALTPLIAAPLGGTTVCVSVPQVVARPEDCHSVYDYIGR